MPVAAFSSDAMITDEMLTERVMQGDQDAFRLLFERHRTPMYRFCMLMLGKHAVAEDIYQEAFISLFRACRKGEVIHNVRAYLLTVARRRCLNQMRNNGRYLPLDEDISLTYEMDLDSLGVGDALQDALLRIPAQYRETFLLFEIEGYSYKEVAECLDVSIDIVRNRIYRAKKALQKILDPVLDPRNPGSTEL